MVPHLRLLDYDTDTGNALKLKAAQRVSREALLLNMPGQLSSILHRQVQALTCVANTQHLTDTQHLSNPSFPAMLHLIGCTLPLGNLDNPGGSLLDVQYQNLLSASAPLEGG
jgi:hypothetical protein